MSGEEGFRLFVSYSHRNEGQRDRLVNALAPLRSGGLIAEVWHDRAIDAGDDWRAEIERAMAEADAAIFLLCEHFLASPFCREVEIPRLLQRHRDQGVPVLFVLGDYCGWDELPFIRQFQVIPRDGRPVTSFRPYSKAYTLLQKEIKRTLEGHRPRAAAASSPLPPGERPGERVPLAEQLESPWSKAEALSRLPSRTPHLFGRAAQLQLLDNWPRGVLLWVAEGGYGKSALVRSWLERREFPAGTRFLAHSFYSQGSRNQAVSGRGFLLGALRRLGVRHPADAPDDELGRLLAEAAAAAPTLLVLDGMEPLQQRATDPQLHGTLRDRGVATLLEGLANRPGEALCLVTSRLPLPDLATAPYLREQRLPALRPEEACALLERRGVRGDGEALTGMAARCDGHPLALLLAAEFCHTFLADSAVAFLEREWPTADTEGHHAATIMGWFDRALAEEEGKESLRDGLAGSEPAPAVDPPRRAGAAPAIPKPPRPSLDRELARCLGLFDRPAPWGALRALQRQEPPIPGLTERLHTAADPELLEALARLRQWGLLEADLEHPIGEQEGPELDAHPLVRERFGAELQREAPQAWRAAHSLLFDWFRGLLEKARPDTLEELEPLYRAVGHGCKAGRYRTALDGVYRDRIRRGEQGYTLFQLGAYSSDLAALAGFFPAAEAAGWEGLPVSGDPGLPEEALSEADRSWLLATVAFCLMSLGRLGEAVGPRRLDRQMDKDSEDWDNFCRSSEGLADLLTPLGRWDEAGEVMAEALAAAARIDDPEKRWQRTREAHAYRGRILHGQGRLAEAATAFAAAEAVQAEALPDRPKLYSLPSYDYAQLLLERAGHPAARQEVAERGRYALEIAEKHLHLLSQALDHCTIGQALSALGEPEEARAALDRAVTTMQRAGKIERQPPMHLARAHHLRRSGDLPAAWQDHSTAHAIAQRGGMRTYLAECALLAGNLHLDAAPPETAQAAAEHATAARLIHEDGYGRREAELHLLHARLLHHQHDPAAARAALDQAEARIREVGQWGFWAELEAVGREIGVAVAECPVHSI